MLRSRRPLQHLAACAAAWAVASSSPGAPYNPYADTQEQSAPVAPDGTIRWGTFYKSAQIQQAYERLWNQGACRGTNRAITVPVAENKLVIDRLPEREFGGVVRAVTGPAAGGLLAFDETADTATGREPLVAQFHPAGVTRLRVVGRAPASIVAAGMVVRLRCAVDGQGRVAEPVSALEIVTPPPGFVPDPVRPGRNEPLVATVTSVRRGAVGLRVDAGSVRRITARLATDCVATIDAGRLDLVSPGDTIEAKGRLWAGEGSMGAGTVFVSDVLVSKRPVDGPNVEPGPRTVGGR